MDVKSRKSILNDCPAEFVDDLSSWIDDVETAVNDIKELLEIKGVGDLHQVEDAASQIDNLSCALY